MKRLAFNGGEISPAMSLRSDMDTYSRSCTTLTNFDVLPTGGITRRRGMRHLTPALPSPSILIPYTYSESTTYLIELAAGTLLIHDTETGAILREFHAADMLDAHWNYPDLTQVTWLQINSLLLICSPSSPVMQLKMYSDGSFDFEPFEFASPPWQSEDLQDTEATLTPTSDENTYTITYSYSDDTPDSERNTTEPGDALRFSYYTQQQEAYERAASIKDGLAACTAITPASAYAPGDKLAWEEEPQYEYYICTQDWTGSKDYTPGFDSPANYKDNFCIAESLTGFESIPPITALNSGNTYSRGAKIAIRSGYWRLYTCIRPFNGSSDYTSGCTNPADYPRHFCSGIPIGPALPCGGKWQFFCSGTWHGSYDIRRNHGTGALTEAWEHLGESKSSIGDAANNIITGDEEEEESWLRLYLTSIRYQGATPGASLPSDYCGNRLITYPYRHSMQLTAQNDGLLEDTSPITIPLKSPITSADWSPGAFSARYGYPRLACLHESRLIFAATASQPQTIWMSRTNDINNFTTGDLDTSGLLLEMQTTTQAAICWMTSVYDDILLGTEDAEWRIISANGGTLTAATAKITRQDHIGSAHQPAILADNGVIYCARGSSRVYEYAYNYEINGYRSKDLTIFADHIAEQAGGIISGAILAKPYSAIVFATRSGDLLRMSYNTMHNVNAWHRYKTQGFIESVCTLTHGKGADRLYLITRRTGPNSTTQRSIEVIDDASPYTDGETGLSYTSAMETTALSLPDSNDTKLHTSTLQIYILGDLPATALTLSTGEPFRPIDRTGTLTTGWHNLTAPGGWRYAPTLSLRITGPVPATILAIQA